MKKTTKTALCISLPIIIFIAVCGSLTVCFTFFNFYDYTGWKEVEIKDIGTIKIPQEWKIGEYNDLMYFCDDNNGKVFMLQSNSNPTSKPKTNSTSPYPEHEIVAGAVEDNILSSTFQAVSPSGNFINGVKSNSACYGANDISVDGTVKAMRYIDLDNPKNLSVDPVILYFTDEVDDEMYDKILESFSLFLDED